MIGRLSAIVPLLLGVMLISFLIMNLAPGDPVAAYLTPETGLSDPATVQAIRRSLGLDQPLPIRFVVWVANVFRGNLGYSFVSRRPVLFEIRHRIFNSLLLAGVSLLVSVLIGVLVGIYSALRQYSWSDYAITVLAFAGISLPNFWFAMMLILLFTVRLGWLPSVGMTSLTVTPGTLAYFVDLAKHMVMPVTVMSLASTGRWTRYMRASLLEVVRQDYVRTARSKGLPERVVIYRHALRNALIPIVTLLGMAVPGLISGSFIIESVFGWPGMGRLGVNAIFSRDYPVVMGVTLFSSVLVMFGNLMADIAYAIVDPRIRYR
jgi:peptide/nickel transport system permease protein